MLRAGEVTSGFGLGTRATHGQAKALGAELGAPPYPGTLNVMLRSPLLLRPETAVIADDHHLYWRVVFQGAPCLAHRWSWCPLHIVELVASENLRDKHALNDGSRVGIGFSEQDLAPMPVRVRLVWASLWLFRRRLLYRKGYLSDLAKFNLPALRLASQPMRKK